MVALETVVVVIMLLIGAAAIFGLLYYAVSYCEREFPSVPLIWKVARICLVLMMVFFLIFMILDLMGHPVIVWR